jgi:hypothetical protein
MLTQPIVTGDPLVPPEPPTYCWKLVTLPVAPVAVVGAEDAAGAELAGALAGAEVAAAGVELELDPELQAAAPATRHAPTAATRHLKPALPRRDIPVKRTIAPCRLSAVNSSGPPPHGAAGAAGVQKLIDQ